MPRVDPHNSTEYWWDRHLTGLSLMSADFTTHEYPQHTHDALVIAVTEQGGSVVKSRGELQDATPATLFVFNPEEPHGGWMGRSERWQYRSHYLNAGGAQRTRAVPLALPDAAGARPRRRRARRRRGAILRPQHLCRSRPDQGVPRHAPRAGGWPRRVPRARALGRLVRHAVPAPRQRPQPHQGAAARPAAAREGDRAHAGGVRDRSASRRPCSRRRPDDLPVDRPVQT